MIIQHEKLNNQNTEIIIQQVEQGTRFIMIGGWRSFNGFGNSYFQHPLTKILSVNLKPVDDRRNVPQGLIITPADDLPEFNYLEWSCPPIICGYNEIIPKNEAKILAWANPIISNGKSIQFKNQLIPFISKLKINQGYSLSCITISPPLVWRIS